MAHAALFAMLLLLGADTKPVDRPLLTTGLFIGSIEEGARIFGPARLLPKEHPEALGHDFPNPSQLRGTEFESLVWLGRHVGLELEWTLRRYPSEPDPSWPYAEFAPPPLEALKKARVIHLPYEQNPLPGLSVVAFYRGFPALFIVDTRGMSLAERGMKRVTTSGLDISRSAFLDALQRAARASGPADAVVIVYDRGRPTRDCS